MTSSFLKHGQTHNFIFALTEQEMDSHEVNKRHKYSIDLQILQAALTEVF